MPRGATRARGPSLSGHLGRIDAGQHGGTTTWQLPVGTFDHWPDDYERGRPGRAYP
jgi:hypothetical protein